jgi:hypothetical protein
VGLLVLFFLEDAFRIIIRVNIRSFIHSLIVVVVVVEVVVVVVSIVIIQMTDCFLYILSTLSELHDLIVDCVCVILTNS